ncbi:hypothetical protein IG631_18609 [Alternaria alternata]|nr:hypothetical protein IG631_18609 [Alternaria alternata]
MACIQECAQRGVGLHPQSHEPTPAPNYGESPRYHDFAVETSPNIEISTPQPISKVDALQLVVSPEQYHDRKDTEEITRLESQRQAHVYQQTAEDVLNHSVDILVKAIVRHKTLSRRFRGIVRRSRDDFDLELLRRVLIATKLDDDWKMFGETLLFDAVKDGNRSLIDALLNAGVDDMASDGISSPSEFAEFLLATSPPLGSFENPMA